jgi:hypothetical protein
VFLEIILNWNFGIIVYVAHWMELAHIFTYLPGDGDDDDRCGSKKTKSVRFEVLTAVIIRILILRDMVPCSSVEWRFGGYCKRLKWRQRVVPKINGGINRFRRNVDTCVPNSKASRPKGP